jgi:hypothetical protein
LPQLSPINKLFDLDTRLVAVSGGLGGNRDRTALLVNGSLEV